MNVSVWVCLGAYMWRSSLIEYESIDREKCSIELENMHREHLNFRNHQLPGSGSESFSCRALSTSDFSGL